MTTIIETFNAISIKSEHPLGNYFRLFCQITSVIPSPRVATPVDLGSKKGWETLYYIKIIPTQINRTTAQKILPSLLNETNRVIQEEIRRYQLQYAAPTRFESLRKNEKQRREKCEKTEDPK